MDWRDFLPFVAGIVVIILVAVVLQPGHNLTSSSNNISGTTGILSFGTTPPTPTSNPVTFVPTTPTPTPTPAPTSKKIPVQIVWTQEPTPVPSIPLPQITPYRIYYNSTPLLYPRIKLPDNMINYGASDVIQNQYRDVEFAYMEEPRGGITQIFTVPYPVWVLNATITSKQPQYAHFRMLLCDASTGEIYQGAEIWYSGTMYKSIPISGKPMYMIISTQYIDRFHVGFEVNADYL